MVIDFEICLLVVRNWHGTLSAVSHIRKRVSEKALVERHGTKKVLSHLVGYFY